MLNKTISPAVAVTVAGLSVLLAVFVTSNGLAAKERSENAPKKIDMAYCTSCHTDAKTLRRMKEKEGSCGFLFGDKKALAYLAEQTAKEKAHPGTWQGGKTPDGY